jgi:hypothetical protein
LIARTRIHSTGRRPVSRQALATALNDFIQMKRQMLEDLCAAIAIAAIW